MTLKGKSDWEKFFDNHAPQYMKNCFTVNTLNEVDFLLEELQLAPGARILDLGCGTGRHSVELARRGFTVTGVDLSSGMLAEARKHADESNVSVEWIQANAVEFEPAGRFDAALCLCEGAFGLLGSADDAIEQPLGVLKSIARALEPKARCLLTVLNGYRLARQHTQSDVENNVFDPLTLSALSDVPPEFFPEPLQLRERGFVPTELALLFRMAGLKVLNIWGGTAGNWRHGSIELDEYEIMIVAEK